MSDPIRMMKGCMGTNWHVNYYTNQPMDERGYCYGTFLGHREVIYVVPLIDEIMERINTGKPLISMEDEWEAYRWLESHKVHRALETGQPISIPISNFELTINNHYFDLEGSEISIKLGVLDSNRIMKALAEQAMKDDILYQGHNHGDSDVERMRLGFWNPRAIPTFNGPIRGPNGENIWPDHTRGSKYRDEHSKDKKKEDAPKEKRKTKKSKSKKKSS